MCLLGYEAVAYGDPCEACALGSYKNETGLGECLGCDDFQTTAEEGADNFDDCFCMSGAPLPL